MLNFAVAQPLKLTGGDSVAHQWLRRWDACRAGRAPLMCRPVRTTAKISRVFTVDAGLIKKKVGQLGILNFEQIKSTLKNLLGL